MTKYVELSEELANGAVIARDVWGDEQCVFSVEGEKLAPSFYDNYGVGFDKLPIQDVLCYSNDKKVILGWIPSTEDLDADDWVIIETTTGDDELDPDSEDDESEEA